MTKCILDDSIFRACIFSSSTILKKNYFFLKAHHFVSTPLTAFSIYFLYIEKKNS